MGHSKLSSRIYILLYIYLPNNNFPLQFSLDDKVHGDKPYPHGPEDGPEAGWGSEFVSLKKCEAGSFTLLHKISRTAHL